MIVEAVRLLQGVAGVTGVESKVAHIAFAPNDEPSRKNYHCR